MVRKTISHNDSNWRVGWVSQKPFGDSFDLSEVTEWLAAAVPGDVRLDLMRAGKISDPFVAYNNEDSQWVDARDWWYVRKVALALKEDERAFVIFEGIDYQSAVFADGTCLGRHSGMFSRQVYELEAHTSELAVRVWGSDALPKPKLSPAQKLWARLIAPLFTPPNQPFPDRYATLKCQMQFGWDFAPRLRTCGIWDEAYVVITRSLFIEDAWVRSRLRDDRSGDALVQVVLALDSAGPQRVSILCSVRGKNFTGDTQNYEFDLQVERGQQTRAVEFELRDAREWNPWDRGDPNLYQLEIAVASGDATSESVSDSYTTTFGIRSFHLERGGAQKDAWTFVINGKCEFVRGANWVPLDAIPARLTRADYAARLKQLREANVNFVRVWGGGLREKRAFYDLCDEMGILVWQEFPFAGATLDRFPRDRTFVDFVRGESTAIVRALRNHPSLVVWCGGNEFNTRGNRVIVETLRGLVAQFDGTRPFKPASPYRDESHNWRVWHRFANLRDYKKDRTPFLSEFGLQSAPNLDSLERFMPHEELFPPNKVWQYHHAQVRKLERYAAPVIWGTRNSHKQPDASMSSELMAFISATQRAQSYAFQIAIEHLRRGKARGAAGVAIWQFNDCWPAISWSVVDYYGTPKQAYSVLRRAYSPVLASFDYELTPRRAGQIVRGDLWVVNDLYSSFTNAQLTANLNGNEIYSRRVNVEPNTAQQVGTLDAPLGAGENTLRLKLSWGPAPLSDNEYDLNYCDVGEINPLVALYVAVGNRLMR